MYKRGRGDNAKLLRVSAFNSTKIWFACLFPIVPSVVVSSFFLLLSTPSRYYDYPAFDRSFTRSPQITVWRTLFKGCFILNSLNLILCFVLFFTITHVTIVSSLFVYYLTNFEGMPISIFSSLFTLLDKTHIIIPSPLHTLLLLFCPFFPSPSLPDHLQMILLF